MSNETTKEIKLKDLVVSPLNVREAPNRNDDSIKKLALSIKESSLISKIVLRPNSSGKYEIIAGSRRYYAMLEDLGKDYVMPEKDYIIFEGLEDEEAFLISITENQQRLSLSPYELNRAALRLNQMGYKDKKIADLLNITPYRLKRILHLSQDFNKMPEEVKQELKKPQEEALITDAHWEKIRKSEDPDVIKDTVDFIMDKESSPRDVPSILKSVEKAYQDSNSSVPEDELKEDSAPDIKESDPFNFEHKGTLCLEENGDKKTLKVIGRKGEEEEVPIEYYMDYLRYPEKFKCTVTFKLKVKPIID